MPGPRAACVAVCRRRVDDAADPAHYRRRLTRTGPGAMRRFQRWLAYCAVAFATLACASAARPPLRARSRRRWSRSRTAGSCSTPRRFHPRMRAPARRSGSRTLVGRASRRTRLRVVRVRLEARRDAGDALRDVPSRDAGQSAGCERDAGRRDPAQDHPESTELAADLRKLDCDRSHWTGCRCLGVKGSQVQILSARPNSGSEICDLRAESVRDLIHPPQTLRLAINAPHGLDPGPLPDLGRRSCGADVAAWLNATVPNSAGWRDCGRLRDRAAGLTAPHRGGELGGNTSCVQHHEPVAVSAAQHSGSLSQRGDDVVDNLVFAARIALPVRDVHAVTADEPDTKHDAYHASAH